MSEVSGKSHFWTNILSQINPAVFLKSQTPTIHKKKKSLGTITTFRTKVTNVTGSMNPR